MFLSSFWSTLLIWVPVSFPSLLVPCTFSFVSLSIAFIFSSNLQPDSTNSVSFLITSVLNCASDRLAISSSLSCVFSGALICSFLWAIYFFLSWWACYIRGTALGIYQDGVTLVAALWCCMWGRGPTGSNGACSTLCQFSVTFLATHNQIGPFWCWFPGGWACVCSRTLWVSPTNSPVRLGVSPAATSIPAGVFSQWFEALFPCTGALGFTICHLVHQLLPRWPAVALPTLVHNLPPCWVCQPPPCCESSPPGCLSPCLLVVWMNVSSLSPWLSDFHTVQFSVSSGCFLFLNCCCPSFGCARRHSLSTYASILAGSSESPLFKWSICQLYCCQRHYVFIQQMLWGL